jgi:hypothetical protein
MHEKSERILTYVGFVINKADKCVYYRHSGGERVVLCFWDELKVIEEVKTFLSITVFCDERSCRRSCYLEHQDTER